MGGSLGSRGGGGLWRGWCSGDPATVRERASPLSHPFEIQVQGHEPREGWQRGPAPGQTGSHRTGPRSSSPCPAPSHPSSPHLAQAGLRVRQATPSGQSRAVHDKSPITQPQHPLGEAPCREAPSAPLCMGHYQSLLFMINLPHSQAVPPLGLAHVLTSPWQQWQDHLTQCERATGQVLPIWTDGETFWEDARAEISHL